MANTDYVIQEMNKIIKKDIKVVNRKIENKL